MISVEEAWALIVQHVQPLPPRAMPLASTFGLHLAEDVVSTIDSPPFDKAMMDGFAVRVEDLQSNRSAFPISGEIAAGETASVPLTAGTVMRIMTGAPIPENADAVIPLEWTATEQGSVTFHRGRDSRVRLNILPRGESMKQGDLLFRAGEQIRSPTVAMMAETGHAAPLVRPAPSVGILATGNELVEIHETPGPGQIRNTNALMLAAQTHEAGAIPHSLGIARDDRDELRERIQTGLQFDVLCLSGGVSAGAYDLVPSVLNELGVVPVFHKIAMKPGKPCWFGIHPESAAKGPTIVFGLPGNPVSSMVCFELFVRLALRRLSKACVLQPELVSAELMVPVRHRGDRPTWFPATLSLHQGRLQVQTASWKGSADLRGTSQANCSLVIPVGEIHWECGHNVTVLPWGSTLANVREIEHGQGRP